MMQLLKMIFRNWLQAYADKRQLSAITCAESPSARSHYSRLMLLWLRSYPLILAAIIAAIALLFEVIRKTVLKWEAK